MISVLRGRSTVGWMILWLVLSASALIISISFNWSHWGNGALVNDDIHREFVTPMRISQGDIIYKNFNYVYQPLPPYLNSWIIKIPFFNTFTILRFVALGVFFLNLLVLWLICCDIELPRVFGPALFGIITWTNSYTFNPTTFNAAYATLFATFGTWCAIRTLGGKVWPWFGLGIACAGALLSKPEGVFVVGLAFIGAWGYNYYLHKRLYLAESLICFIGFIALALPFVVFLFYKGLSCYGLVEGLLQRRFQKNLYAGFIEQYNYFMGINHIIVIAAGCIFIALVFMLLKLYLAKRWFPLWLAFSVISIIIFIFALSGQLIRVLDDYKTLGAFFGGISGYWWYRQLPEGNLKKGFIIFWLASLGGWLRPLFHIGALVIPFRVGGGMLLAVIFWFLILPSLFQKVCPALIGHSDRIKDSFMRIGCLCVLIFGFIGLFSSWNIQWRHSTVKFETPYGHFFANADDHSTQVGIKVINWFRQNVKSKQRIVVLEALPIELVLGWLPCIPLSQLNYQIYEGDAERIISALDKRPDIEYVLVQVRHGGYHFGIQDYKLADYLDTKWKQVERIEVPRELTTLSSMSPNRKCGCGLIRGFIIYGRR